ncbi:MarR family winged helix-turn-helix transcriptional regulator [Pelagibius sp.]|uniref:MarR family winged helix-turn-helix transcriptional regulator n=1 Tax=Pelagibius sp. TaxID=1931238 RepID=UPI003B50ED29
MESIDDLGLLLERLARVLQNEAHSEGLKPTQWEALRYLGRANRFSRTPSGVTAYLGMTKGTVSQTLNALERKGLIGKRIDPQDRRQVALRLTAKGSRLLARDPIEALLRGTAGLSAEQRETLTEGLQRLLAETLRRRGGQPFGLCRTCRHFSAEDPAGSPHRCRLLEVPLTEEDGGLICAEQEAAA